MGRVAIAMIVGNLERHDHPMHRLDFVQVRRQGRHDQLGAMRFEPAQRDLRHQQYLGRRFGQEPLDDRQTRRAVGKARVVMRLVFVSLAVMPKRRVVVLRRRWPRVCMPLCRRLGSWIGQNPPQDFQVGDIAGHRAELVEQGARDDDARAIDPAEGRFETGDSAIGGRTDNRTAGL